MGSAFTLCEGGWHLGSAKVIDCQARKAHPAPQPSAMPQELPGSTPTEPVSSSPAYPPTHPAFSTQHPAPSRMERQPAVKPSILEAVRGLFRLPRREKGAIDPKAPAACLQEYRGFVASLKQNRESTGMLSHSIVLIIKIEVETH
ncbi:hypothetical protein INR49_020263 [Caranx melampygus]|nr:hypothetical protein INR49_020263 [Caranx melampygus]